jgi:hypothetical protein
MGVGHIERLKIGVFRMRRVVGYLLMAASMILIVFMAFRAFFAWLVEGTSLDLLVDGLLIGAGVLGYAVGLALVTSVRRD